ncbi:hypothetical protein PRIPAC_82090, partial [Pristionchus pacificus]|uniref:Uncharacterized protein n=1 Tax=Pristionchus pacificus TaxID=54126 RepID=A0A2A6CLT3_PRIPA
LQMFSMNTLLVITNTIGGLSVILNLCLLTLISFNTPAQLGAFRKNYYGMTVVDTLFALAQFLAAPCFFSDGSVYFIFSSRSGGSYLLIFFMVMHNTSFVSISFNFYCRYLMVCKLKINFESDFILGSAQETLCGTGMFAYIKHHSSSNRMRLINYRILVILTTQASMSALCVYTPGLITAVFELIEYDGNFFAYVFRNLVYTSNCYPTNTRISDE